MKYDHLLDERRRAAYRRGEYTFTAPPVCSARWDESAWCNYVTFRDPALTGVMEPPTYAENQWLMADRQYMEQDDYFPRGKP